MHEYYCKKCRLLFEDSISQSRCPAFRCQSPDIKEINTPYRFYNPKIYSFAFETLGEEFERIRDKQGLVIRQAQQEYEKELKQWPQD